MGALREKQLLLPGTPQTLATIDSFSLEQDVRFTFQSYILRALSEGRDPFFHFHDFVGWQYRKLAFFKVNAVGAVFDLTEAPNGPKLAGVSAGEIAARTGRTPNLTSAVLGRLQEEGFVDKAFDPQDRRQGKYVVADRFLAAGFLMGYSPLEWGRRIEDGSMLEELQTYFDSAPNQARSRSYL